LWHPLYSFVNPVISSLENYIPVNYVAYNSKKFQIIIITNRTKEKVLVKKQVKESNA
jgi:hypothetical protein